MRHSLLLLLAISVVLSSPGCEKRAETPPDVTQAYNKLLSSLDPSAPGASVARLQGFARQNSRYAISSSVEIEVEAWRNRLEEAYLKGRDLAREDQFDRAEAILKDLAENLQNERAGRLAREFLAFEFHYMKASRLLLKGDTAAAEAVARDLMQKHLTEEQMVATQRLLDSVSTAGLGLGMTRMTSLRSAARSLQVFLHSYYAEQGQYPKALTLEGPEIASLRNSGSFSGIVSTIEDYATAQDGFSLVITGRDSRQRLRVTQSTIEEVRPAGRP
jgi:hypothetical protein